MQALVQMMKSTLGIFSAAAITSSFCLTALCAPAVAQSAAEFYKGRTLDLIVGFPPGGGYDLYARPVANHLGRYLGEGANITVRYMPGAGSLLASNYMYTVPPKDGSVLAVLSPTLPLDARLTPAVARFDPTRFTWVGRISPAHNVAFVWHTAPVKTLDDVRKTEITLAGTGVGSNIVVYPTVTNNVLGTKFKMILGYKGSAEAMLAVERGEVQGHSTSVEAVKTAHPDWIKDGKIRFLVQYGSTRHPLMPEVPTVLEAARTQEEKDILGAVMTAVEIGRSIISTPGVPADRVEALRRGFDRMMKDPQFIADLARGSIQPLPATGEEVAKIVDSVANMPDELIVKVKAAHGGG